MSVVESHSRGTQNTNGQPAPEVLLDAPIPHACEPETLPARSRPTSSRLIGVDVARALALVGMISVHLFQEVSRTGVMSLPFVLASGKSAALFAVLAGVGIAFSTGRDRPPRGRRLLGSMASVLVRAVLITIIGLALGSVIPGDMAHVILASYGVMFFLAIPLLRLRPAILAALALIIAIVVPILSHLRRQELALTGPNNPGFDALFDGPLTLLREIMLTGTFPALAWMAYVCAGLAVGRLVLSLRTVAIRLVAIGAIAAVTASAGSWFLLDRMGGREALAAAAAPIMSRQDFADVFVWGADGTLPTNSPWWLAVLAPHTTTPFDLLFTMGVALAVLGVALIFALVAPGPLRPIARFGSMPLTIYVMHLLLLLVPFLPDEGMPAFLTQLLILGAFALVWSHFFKRGPLESVLWWAAHSVKRLVGGRPGPARAHSTPASA